MIEDYAYGYTEFMGDIDLDIPVDDQWDNVGEQNTMKFMFLYFMSYDFLCILTRPNYLTQMQD